MDDVEAVSSSDVWAVGIVVPSSNPLQQHPLSEHWDGNRWTIVSVQEAAPMGGFFGLTSTSEQDLWAVGFKQKDSETGTLTEHSRGCKSPYRDDGP